MATFREKSVFRTSEIVGVLFIVLLGSFLHFTYELSGRSPLVAVFSAVNESVWEHLKLAFWPGAIFGLFQYFWLGRHFPGFLFGKTLGVLLMPLIIVFGFYGYTLFMPINLLLDIGLFVVAVVAGQLVSYRLILAGVRGSGPYTVFALVFLAVLFAVFTFYPPDFELFRDPAA